MRYVMDGSFLTGCELVDTQHGQLFDAINGLLAACESGSDRDGLKKSLNFLSDYTVKHFFDEEQLLKKNGFTDLAHHHQYHEAFKKVVRDLSHDFIITGVSEALIRSVQDKIGTWLIEHIKGQDFRWAKELKEKAPDMITRITPEYTAKITGTIGKSAAAAPGAKTASGKAVPANEHKKYISESSGGLGICHKIICLTAIPALAAFVGLGILVRNVLKMMGIVRNAAGEYSQAMAQNSPDQFNVFLKSAQTEAGVLQTLSLIIAALAALALIALIPLLVSAITRWIIRPVEQALLLCKSMVRDGSAQNVSVKSGDELAQMLQILSETQKGIRSLIRAVNEKAGALSAAGTEMQRVTSDSVAAINRVNAGIRAIQSKSFSQSEGVAKTGSAVDRVIANIGALNGRIENQAESLSRSSSAIEEMISNISSISTKFNQNEQDLDRLRDSSSRGNAALQKVSSDIQDVSKESERLLEINKVIQNIASQTNLLAMNAAIEAAHAGDIGRGFAVVADEIRKLAESSSQQAKTVSGVLKNIKDSLGGISASTIASLKQFEEIDRGFETVSSQGMEIRNAMARQDAGNREVLKTMSLSNEITKNVQDNSVIIQSSGQEAVGEGKNLEILTGEVTAAVNEIISGMDTFNAAIIRTGDLSRKNKEDIDNLVQEITQFRIN